jgi:two-component system response regulator LytT
MRVVIFEDEQNNAERLVYLLNQCGVELEKVTVIPSVKEGIKWFRDQPDADLVFMDIQLSDGNCFEIFENMDSRVPIIFTTAYDNFALQAFKLYSLDYLLKPIDIPDLKRALGKYEQVKPIHNPYVQFSKIAEEFFKRDDARFIGKMNNQLVYVKAKNIAYLNIEDGIVWATTTDKQKIPLDYSLDQIEKNLDRSLFFRINRKTIIHIDSIQKITTYYNNRLILQLSPTGDTDNIISRERVNGFKSWLQGNPIA